ncbi:MAG TPA: 3-keto-5-aminohexanoate cleavage protein, partial [Candidatus Dormibacteraeota bacterium]|nr:3-keto-5-aminohexanoate cleavage protein [Candidatus Dormibacteraeota bacterium]
MLIKACLNGSRAPGVHPALPVTPAALAIAAADAVTAGAGAIHFHVRDAQGRESLAPDDVARTLIAVRAVIPKTPIGVSTGAWIVPDPAERHALVAKWPELPDFASVNFHEPGAAALVDLLLARGVAVEAGVRDGAAAELLVNSGLAQRCVRVMFEPAADVL